LSKSRKFQNKQSELETELEKVMDWLINSERNGTRTIQYPVMLIYKVSKELDKTWGVDTSLYAHAPTCRL